MQFEAETRLRSFFAQKMWANIKEIGRLDKFNENLWQFQNCSE